MLIDRSFSELVSSDTRATRRPERRASARIPVEVDVMIGGGGRVVTCVSGNVSLGGFCVATYRLADLGATVWFRFQLPTGVIVGSGVVRWVREGSPGRPPAMGVQHVKLGPADRDSLERFCLRPCA